MQIHIVANIINNIEITWNEDCGSTPNLLKPWLCCLSLWCCLWPKLISEFKFYFKGKHPNSLSELGERNLASCHLVVFWSLAYLQVCSLSLKNQKGGAEVLGSQGNSLRGTLSFPRWKAPLYQRLHKNLLPIMSHAVSSGLPGRPLRVKCCSYS